MLCAERQQIAAVLVAIEPPAGLFLQRRHLAGSSAGGLTTSSPPCCVWVVIEPRLATAPFFPLPQGLGGTVFMGSWRKRV